jgi:hypothetical protein
MEAKKGHEKKWLRAPSKKSPHGPPQCFPLTHRHSDTGLEGCLRQSRQQAKVSDRQCVIIVCATVTQFESVSLPLRVALRISASSPQGPKVRSPFVAPSCRGFLRLLCVSFARALRLVPRAPFACFASPATTRLFVAVPLTNASPRLPPSVCSFARALGFFDCAGCPVRSVAALFARFRATQHAVCLCARAPSAHRT